VTKRKTRISGALLIVVVSLLMASMACYSNQIPGVFELTPYYTPTPFPVAENARFGVLQEVLAPKESGSAFFNLTTDPEPLLDSLVNSKTMCQGNSAAQVLYAGTDSTGTYYLVECSGSVGWTAEDRLAGPLYFATGDLALTVAAAGSQSVTILDDNLQPMPMNPLLSCKPETIVSVSEIQAADPDGDGTKDVFYRIECPVGNKGWVTNADLAGPVEMNVDDRALALSSVDAMFGDLYRLANEPAPVTDANAVEGDCYEGSILVAQEAQLIGDTVYYKMQCGEIEGWTSQDRFVGPLLYDVGEYTVIYVEPQYIFADQVPTELTGEVAAVGEEEGQEGDAVAEEPAPVEEEGAAPTGEEERRVVQYTPPLYLTDKPGPAVPAGDDANVVGQCNSNTAAYLEEFAALESIYYRISCDECVATETDSDGEAVCTAYETRNGWVEQKYLEGPIDYVPGQMVTFKPTSLAIEESEDGIAYARIPANLAGAAALGRYTEFSGRCPADEGVEVTGVMLEKARTSNTFSFYYQIQCTGQQASIRQVTEGGVTRPEVTYDPESEALITGFASARDLQAMEE
jgi:hypothetical protein